MPAKLTHRIYGISRIPAVIDTFAELNIVNSMAIHKTTITRRPAIGDLSPKKATDQEVLRINCIMNIIKAIFTFGSLNPTLHTRKADIPISMNSIVQTGANNQFGGLKDGFSRVVYHVGIEVFVNMEPMKPAARHTPIHMTNLMISIPLMCSTPRTSILYHQFSTFKPTTPLNRIIWLSFDTRIRLCCMATEAIHKSLSLNPLRLRLSFGPPSENIFASEVFYQNRNTLSMYPFTLPITVDLRSCQCYNAQRRQLLAFWYQPMECGSLLPQYGENSHNR